MKRNHIVLTTIHDTDVLDEYYKNISTHGKLQSTKIWVVGDKKTPLGVEARCLKLSVDGLETEYLDIARQDAWGKRFPELYARIPYNNETRRNIGYLHALEDGCEILISIDDDNWPTTDDFVGCHGVTGTTWNGELISNASGYYNICTHLTFDTTRHIFPRGYPFTLRNTEHATQTSMVKPEPSTRIGATAGLWLVDPDVDATTWLAGKISSISFSGPDTSALHGKTWSPVNTQNTSVVRELIPAFFCIPMGFDVPVGKIQRYGDIWGGYFLQAVMSDTKYVVAFGRPLVDHRRNPHNYMDDLRYEFWGMMLTDWMVGILRECKPKETSVVGKMKELSEFLSREAVDKLPDWCATEVRDFMRQTAKNIMLWSEACEKILSL